MNKEIKFDSHFSDGEPTNFRDKILSGEKKTTIRKDMENRLEIGTNISFLEISETGDSECFGQSKIDKISVISIDPYLKKVLIRNPLSTDMSEIFIESKSDLMNRLLAMEGFDTEDDFWKWFKKPFMGKLIVWEPISRYTVPGAHNKDKKNETRRKSKASVNYTCCYKPFEFRYMY